MPSPSLDSTLGALEIGCLLSVFSFGVLCAQIHTYYSHFRGQSYILDFAVFVVCCFDLGQTLCVAYATYVGTITTVNTADKTNRLINIPTLPLAILFSCLTELVVRLVYIQRIRLFSGNQYIAAVFFVLSGLACVGGIWASSVAFIATTFTGYIQQWGWLNTLVLSLIVVTDSMIAITLCYYLKRSANWLGRPSKMIDILIRWTLETGLLTSFTALAQIICFESMMGNFIYIAIYALLPKLYSNSLLALLNGRIALRDMATEAHSPDIPGELPEVQPAGRDALLLKTMDYPSTF